MSIAFIVRFVGSFATGFPDFSFEVEEQRGREFASIVDGYDGVSNEGRTKEENLFRFCGGTGNLIIIFLDCTRERIGFQKFVRFLFFHAESSFVRLFLELE